MSSQQQSQIDQNHQDTNGNMMSNNSSAPNYKTSLCHQWLTNGQCPRGQSCNYAHGTAEIRPRYGEGPAALYKNSLCKFWQSGKCAHGDQCNYAHGLNELRPLPSSTASSLSSLGSSNAFPAAPPLTSAGIGATKDQQLPLFHPNAPNAAMFMGFLGPPPPPCLPPPPSFMSAFPPPPPPQPYLMSNPQPPNGLANPFATPPLWGQPPPPALPPPQIHSLLPPPIPLPSIAAAFSNMNSSPTSLNSLLKREHFQPLTGGGGTTTNSSSSTSASSKTILQTKNGGGNVGASLNGQQQKENNNASIGGGGGGTNVPLAAANAKGSTAAATKTNPMNMLFSGHRSSPFFADFHRSRSSSIPSNKSPTPNHNQPQPFTMAQIAQQFENANIFGGLSATSAERRAATPDFNTNNDADFPSLNCATKKQAQEEEKGKDKEKQQKSTTTLTEVKTQPASTTTTTPAAATFEQPQKSFANIAAKTPAAFAAEAAKKSTKMATTTVKHSASAGCVVTVQQQQQKYTQQKGGMPTPTTTATKMKKSTAPTPPAAPPLGLVQKAITRPAPKKSTTISVQKHANSVPSTPFLRPQISLSSTTNPSPPPTSSLAAATTNEKDEDGGGGGKYASAIGGLAKNTFDDLFENDPFLNHARNLEETMFKSIERTTSRNTGEDEEAEEEVEEEEVADRHKVEEDEEVAEAPNEWHTVVSSRHRKSSLNAEYFSHRPSPCTDDGYQEGFSSGEEYNPHQQANQSGGTSGGRMADSPASISQQSDGTNRQQQSSNANGNSGETPRLDKSHIFYRTHICLFWQNNREGKGPPCKHGERCFYAHGEKKLIKLNPIYFKTTLCEAFNNGEQCPYGNACNFAHGEKDMRKPAFNGVDSKKTKFFSVPHRHQLRKQRGMQTVHCIPTIAKPVEKVVVIKTNPWEDNNKK